MKTSLKSFCDDNNVNFLSREQQRQVTGGKIMCTTLYGDTTSGTQTISGECAGPDTATCVSYGESIYGSLCDSDPTCGWVQTTCA